jgi:hypothetical protein
MLHKWHVTLEHVSGATTKTTRLERGLLIDCDLGLPFLLQLQTDICACFASPALPNFAMIFLVRRLYDPDATTAP